MTGQTVKIQTNYLEVKAVLIGESMVLKCEMTREQIKESIRSMLGVITDREWGEIVEELTPELLMESTMVKFNKEY